MFIYESGLIKGFFNPLGTMLVSKVFQGNTIRFYNTQSANAYASAKEKALGKTTITSDLSDDERNNRIKEINSELSKLKDQRNGLSRAAMYGNVY